MDDEVRGIGGWLAFFLLILAVLSPVLSIFFLWYEINIAPPRGGAHAGALNALDWGTLVLQIAIGWFITWRLVAIWNWTSVRIAVAGLWLGSLAVALMSYGGYAWVEKIPVGTLLAATPFSRFVDGLAFNIIWTAYLLNARRVANTYRDPAEQAEVFE